MLNVLSKTPYGQIKPVPFFRGKAACPTRIPEHVINDHIESFQPTVSHYRREHAPKTRYLPSDITIKFMHEDFF